MAPHLLEGKEMKELSKASVVALVALVAACGSNADDQVVPDFQGVYTSTTQGALGTIAFSTDHHYLLMPTGCQAQSCTELGSWQYDAAGHALTLTNARSETRTMRVDVVSTSNGASPSGGLVTKDDLTDPSQVLSGNGSQLNNGNSSQLNNGSGSQLNSGNSSQLANGQSKLADSASQLLQSIAKAMLDQQGMQQQQQQDQAGGGDQPAAAKPAVKPECQAGIPTPDTPAAETAAYWASCPQGPATPQ